MRRVSPLIGVSMLPEVSRITSTATPLPGGTGAGAPLICVGPRTCRVPGVVLGLGGATKVVWYESWYSVGRSSQVAIRSKARSISACVLVYW